MRWQRRAGDRRKLRLKPAVPVAHPAPQPRRGAHSGSTRAKRSVAATAANPCRWSRRSPPPRGAMPPRPAGPGVAAHHTSRHVHPIRPISSTSQPKLRPNEVRPDARIIGRQSARRARSRRANRRRSAARALAPISEDIAGDLGRGVPHVQPPADVLRRGVDGGVSGQLNPAGVAQTAQRGPVFDGQSEKLVRSTPRSDPPCATSTTGRSGSSVPQSGCDATISAISGTLRRATSTRLSPPRGAHVASLRHSIRAPGAACRPRRASCPASPPDASRAIARQLPTASRSAPPTRSRCHTHGADPTR